MLYLDTGEYTQDEQATLNDFANGEGERMKSWKSMSGRHVIAVIPLGFRYWYPPFISCSAARRWVAAVLHSALFTTGVNMKSECVNRRKILQQTAIRTLNHHRHDWMNDLQVLIWIYPVGQT